MKKAHFLFLATVTVVLLLTNAVPAFAYVVEDLGFENEGDIVIGPGKTEVWLAPGDNYNQEILVSNRSGEDKIFKMTVEDFQASTDPEGTVKFLGDEKGPYSLKDYVVPEISEIILHHGQRMRLPIAISIPEDAEPGGLYGAVMVSAENIDKGPGQVEQGTAGAKMKVITKVASLLFVRVKGEVFEQGALKNFTSLNGFYEKGPVTFRVLFENTGNVHVSPYGTIDIKNLLGNEVGSVEIDPWFVMPGSERTREVKWNSDFLFGKYTATLNLNRGYGDIVDTAVFSFWVIPWRLVGIGFIGLVLFIILIAWLASHLQWKKGKDETSRIQPVMQQEQQPMQAQDAQVQGQQGPDTQNIPPKARK